MKNKKRSTYKLVNPKAEKRLVNVIKNMWVRYDLHPGFDMISFMGKIGINVILEPSPKEIVVNDGNVKEIHITDGYPYSRFYVAKNIAQFFPIEGTEKEDKNLFERCFALHLLAPKEHFVNEFSKIEEIGISKFEDKCNMLSLKFGLSPEEIYNIGAEYDLWAYNPMTLVREDFSFLSDISKTEIHDIIDGLYLRYDLTPGADLGVIFDDFGCKLKKVGMSSNFLITSETLEGKSHPVVNISSHIVTEEKLRFILAQAIYKIIFKEKNHTEALYFALLFLIKKNDFEKDFAILTMEELCIKYKTSKRYLSQRLYIGNI